MLKITLADTDALYCSKPTSSHQSGVFLGSFSEIGGLFPDTSIKLDLDIEDILHNLVRHFVGGSSYYEKDGGGSSITLSQTWLAKQCSDLDAAFRTEEHCLQRNTQCIYSEACVSDRIGLFARWRRRPKVKEYAFLG